VLPYICETACKSTSASAYLPAAIRLRALASRSGSAAAGAHRSMARSSIMEGAQLTHGFRGHHTQLSVPTPIPVDPVSRSVYVRQRLNTEPHTEAPEIPEHLLDPDAVKVVRRLRRAGHEAFLVGGCVRDLLLGIRPKDFDGAPSAHPNRVRAPFRNSRLIGRRFRLAHVFSRGGKITEVSPSRATPLDELKALPQDLLIRHDNVF